MRLFVAVVLSSENQQRLRVPVDRLVHSHADVLRATPHGTAHLTLAFMGRAAESEVDAIGQAMQHVAQLRAPFTITLSTPRVLRAGQDPRLVLLPVTLDGARIEAIARDLQRAITASLPALELSPAKSAHVTLARFRRHARASDGRAVEASLTRMSVAALVLREEVRDVRLFESTLTASGPAYREVLRSPFRAP